MNMMRKKLMQLVHFCHYLIILKPDIDILFFPRALSISSGMPSTRLPPLFVILRLKTTAGLRNFFIISSTFSADSASGEGKSSSPVSNYFFPMYLGESRKLKKLNRFLIFCALVQNNSVNLCLFL